MVGHDSVLFLGSELHAATNMCCTNLNVIAIDRNNPTSAKPAQMVPHSFN
jgi:hypothetical protein